MALSAVNRSRLHATLACAIAGVLWWRTESFAFATIWAVALALLVIAWIAPRRYEPVQRFFTTFGRLVTAAVTWIVLGVVYFLLFTPLRLWNRVIGRDPLGVRASGETTYFQELPPRGTGKFERQY